MTLKQHEYRSGVGMSMRLVKHSRPYNIANAVREQTKITDGATDDH